MKRIGWLLACSLLAPGACTRSLEGAPCPCASGYQCCAHKVCYAVGRACSPEPSGGTGQTSAGGDGSSGAGGNGTSGAGQAFAGSSAGSGAGGTSDLGGGSGSAGLSAGGNASLGGMGALAEPSFALVATQHNDNARTGANLDETGLSTANVNLTSFGELSRRPLRGAVFAQPLVAPSVALPGGTKADAVYVATMANVVYALDARQPEKPPLWTRTLEAPIELPDPVIGLGNRQIWHEVGILGTPVLSVSEGALYAVSATKSGDVYSHRVSKLDLGTGAVLASAIVEQPDFDSSSHAQRAALTLSAGVLYVPFGAYDPSSATSGWVFMYDTNLSPLGGVVLGAPIGTGVSMTGQGLAADDTGSVFFSTDLGTLASTPASAVVGSRSVQLSASDQRPSELLLPGSSTQSGSNELGSSGPLLIPNSDRVVLAGQHRTYVLTRAASGDAGAPASLLQLRASGSSACQLPEETCYTEPSSPIFWPGSGENPQGRLFVWSPNDRLRAFGFDATSGRFDCNQSDIACSALSASPPGDSQDALSHTLASAAHLSVSSNGSALHSGIVWAAHAYTTDDLRNPDGILRAFDAEDLSFSWSTERAGTPLGPLAPGATPTISGGRVFIGTADGISSKQIFWDDWSAGTPALTNFGDKFLVLAWGLTTSQNRGFQLKWSSDGVHFTETSSVSDDFLQYEPALGSDGAHIYLAWTASSGLLKVAVSDDPSFAHLDFMTQQAQGEAPAPLAYQPTTSPALAYGNHHLFLAFHRDHDIVVVSSRDGAPFDTATERTIPGFFSYEAPALAYLNDKLYLISSNEFRQLNLFVSSDDGAHFSGPTPLSMSSFGHPALLTLNPQGSPEPDLHLVWADVTTDGQTWGRIKLAAAADGSFENFARIHELESDQANFSISAAWFKGAWYIAWLGILDAAHPNVARYTPGELVTYGLKPAPPL